MSAAIPLTDCSIWDFYSGLALAALADLEEAETEETSDADAPA